MEGEISVSKSFVLDENNELEVGFLLLFFFILVVDKWVERMKRLREFYLRRVKLLFLFVIKYRKVV